jgi:hypothetical protein
MPRLFKYAAPDAARKIIENGTLRWSTPPLLNDPFDMQFAFQFRVDHQEVRAMALDKLWEHHYGALRDQPLNDLGRVIRKCRGRYPSMTREEFDVEFRDSIDSYINDKKGGNAKSSAEILSHFGNDKIFCFSEAPDLIPMWSYYAQNHAGAVLRFTDETPDSPLKTARPVRYVDQMPSLVDNEALSDMAAGYTGMDTQRILDAVVWTKSDHWAHEREWRIYCGGGRSADPYEDIPFSARELDSVIFGVRMDVTERKTLAGLIKAGYPHVELMQARVSTDAYELSIETAEC